MIVNALITEYNPFHNGHIYHINESKKLTNPDVTIAVMSGQFTQRGEIAITDKFTRAREVIKYVDLVVELPLYYAISFADDFGLGAVQIANMMKATHIIFGSESGEMKELTQVHDTLKSADNNERIAHLMQEGHNYPRALSMALGQDVLSPNNILGLSYLKAIHEVAPAITPLTIKRKGNAYNDEVLSHHQFSSATSIRQAIFNGNHEEARRFMPESLLDSIARPVNNNHLFKILKSIILTHTTGSLRRIYTMGEGLEYRLLSKIRDAHTYDAYLNAVKTKRYTHTRLNRLMLYILFNITHEKFKSYTMPDAVRVLAMNKTGQQYLAKIKSEINIVTNLNHKNSHNFKNEIMATDIYNTISGSNDHDFNTPVIIHD